MSTRKAPLTAADLVNFEAISEVAWNDCDDRKLTKVEKVAVTLKAIVDREQPFRVSDISARACISQREMCAVLKAHMGLINEVLGTNYEYSGASYHASGAGAFGRYGGGKRGSYNEPTIVSMG